MEARAPAPQQLAAEAPSLGMEEALSLSLSAQLAGNGQVKARKPYTLTKQRERWTDEEHAKFLEALKLHGRAWRKIEEHVSTKSAVQIRSHAQKFISKLERNKDSGSTDDVGITIPPPRPKRKPARPYPRKDPGPDNSGSGVNGGGNGTTSGMGTAPGCQQNSKPSMAATARPSASQQLQGNQQQQVQQQHHHHHHQQRASSQQQVQQPQQHHQQRPSSQQQVVQQQHQKQSVRSAEVTEATVAAVAAAASAAAAAAAAAVVAAAGQQVQAHLQAHPPQGFPFFGVPPSLLAQVTLQHPALEAFASSGQGRARDNRPSFQWPPLQQQQRQEPDDQEEEDDDEEEDDEDDDQEQEEGTRLHHHQQQQQAPQAGGMAEAMATTTDGDNMDEGPESRGSDGNSFCSREAEDMTPEAAGGAEQAQSGRHAVQLQGPPQPAASGPWQPWGLGAQAQGGEQDIPGVAQYWQLLGLMDGARPAVPPPGQREAHHIHTHVADRLPKSTGSGGPAGNALHHTKDAAPSRDRDAHKKAARSPGYSGEVVRPVAVRCGGQSESPSQQDASGQGAKHGTAGGRSDGNGNGSSDDTNGSNSAPFKAAANVDRGTREAQGSNPTHCNNGNGNGHSSGNGSAGNANGSGSGSQGNGNGSSGNGSSGNGSGGNGQDGSGGNGNSLKDSNTVMPNGHNGSSGNGTGTSHHHHAKHHHHHAHMPPRPPAYDAGRYPKHSETQDRDGNGASGIGTRVRSSSEDLQAAASVGATRASAAVVVPTAPAPGLTQHQQHHSGLPRGSSRSEGGAGSERPAIGQPGSGLGGHTSAFSVPPPSTRAPEMSNVQVMLAALQAQATMPPFHHHVAGALPGLPPSFAQQALAHPSMASQPFFATATAAANAIVQRSMLAAQQQHQQPQQQPGPAMPVPMPGGPGSAFTPAAPSMQASAKGMPPAAFHQSASAYVLMAAAAQLQQQQQRQLLPVSAAAMAEQLTLWPPPAAAAEPMLPPSSIGGGRPLRHPMIPSGSALLPAAPPLQPQLQAQAQSAAEAAAAAMAAARPLLGGGVAPGLSAPQQMASQPMSAGPGARDPMDRRRRLAVKPRNDNNDGGEAGQEQGAATQPLHQQLHHHLPAPLPAPRQRPTSSRDTAPGSSGKRPASSQSAGAPPDAAGPAAQRQRL